MTMPRLTRLQQLLWIAAILTLGAFAVAYFLDRGPAGSVTEAFRPTFALPDATGKLRTSEEFRGKFQLVFFGFTNCPDVCPTTLAEVAQVMDDLGSEADRVQPIFISVDPERDRRLGLDSYTRAFHPSILGLAGDVPGTAVVAARFKVFFKREDDTAAPGGYSMAHSPALYLVGPEGDWLRQFAYGTPAADILSDLQSRF
ncbi:SCO family protein [Neotabrizicola sp. VNH66]